MNADEGECFLGKVVFLGTSRNEEEFEVCALWRTRASRQEGTLRRGTEV